MIIPGDAPVEEGSEEAVAVAGVEAEAVEMEPVSMKLPVKMAVSLLVARVTSFAYVVAAACRAKPSIGCA